MQDFDAAISTADWIIEVIVEKLEMKQALMARIDAVRRKAGQGGRVGSLVTSNTSGLLIHEIAEGRSLDFRQHFIGHPLLQSATLHETGRSDAHA